MGTRLTLLVIGLLVVGLAVLNPPATEAFRLYLSVAGIFLILAAATLRRGPRQEIAANVRDRGRAAVADAGDLEPAAPVAPPRAEVTLQVCGDVALWPTLRWYHVAAATSTDVAARKAHVRVAVRGERVGAEPWRWKAGDSIVDLTQAGTRIPIVIGCVRESPESLTPGWVVPFKSWYLTPNATSAVGRFLAPFIAGIRHVFDVTVSWAEGGVEQSSTASFELRFWREPTSEPRFIRMGDRPSYRDQVGGLGELRDRGAVLRKEGMMLPLAALGVWLGRVESWTSETRSLIAEVSTADSEYFAALKNFNAPLFEGVRLHDERHRKTLRELHERLIRLQFFMRPAETKQPSGAAVTG